MFFMNWVEDEFSELSLGDNRLNERCRKIIGQLGLAPGRTIPQTFQTWGEIKATYNFFGNDAVSEKKLLKPHMKKTIERIQEYPVVLLISDTTELDYTSKIAMEGRERVTNKKKGLWLHPTMAITSEKLPLGLVEINFWSRRPDLPENSSAYRNARDKAPIKDKESYRWLQSYQAACKISRETPNTQIIHVCDSEADIIEIFEDAEQQRKQSKHANFIIRSKYDRQLLETDEEGNHKKLRKNLLEAPSLGEVEFTIASTERRKGRIVKQQLKSATLILNRGCKDLTVQVNAIMAFEKAPPKGEEPITWILITDLPINTFEDVNKVISYYICRWQIELLFKALKSGCKIEERQLQTTGRMKNLITIFLILAWRVLFTMMIGRRCPEILCSDIFNNAEWKSVYKILNRKSKLPETPPKLKEFIVMVATLGGYVNHKNAEPPGIKVMWKGLMRMIDFALAWESFSEDANY